LVEVLAPYVRFKINRIDELGIFLLGKLHNIPSIRLLVYYILRVCHVRTPYLQEALLVLSGLALCSYLQAHKELSAKLSSRRSTLIIVFLLWILQRINYSHSLSPCPFPSDSTFHSNTDGQDLLI